MKNQIELVADWNSRYKPGMDVIVTLDDKSEWPTKTRSEAQMLGASRDYPGHTAVIWLEGKPGCYRLDRVRPA